MSKFDSMKCLLLGFALSAGPLLSTSQTPARFIDPTGTYTLKANVRKNHLTGYSGELRVLLLDSGRAAFCFFLSDGYPSYRSVTLLDTLTYDALDDQIRYTSASNTACTILFNFSPTGVEVLQVLSDPPCQCGYNADIFVPEVFGKSSSAKPIIQDLAVHRNAL
jgi:hypothetical protein